MLQGCQTGCGSKQRPYGNRLTSLLSPVPVTEWEDALLVFMFLDLF